MDKNARKANSAEARAKKVIHALLLFMAHMAAKGELDLAAIRAALRPPLKPRTRNRIPSADHKPTDLLTPDQAGRILKLSSKTLANKRSRGDGPRYVKLSDRAVRYRYQDLIDFAERGSRMSTSQNNADAEPEKSKKPAKSRSLETSSRHDISVVRNNSVKPRNKALRGQKKGRRKANR